MSEHTITTTATGRASAPPDEVDITFSASALEPDVTGARRAVAEQATLLREALDAVDVPDEQVRTVRFRIRQRSPDRGEHPEDAPQPYHATETIGVTLLDLDRLGETLSAAVEQAGVEIDEVGFTFRTETRRALQREALADAVETARNKAVAAAAAEDLALGEVRSIVTDDGSRPRRTSAGRQLAVDTTESGTLESGPIDIQVRVEVEYDLCDSLDQDRG